MLNLTVSVSLNGCFLSYSKFHGLRLAIAVFNISTRFFSVLFVKPVWSILSTLLSIGIKFQHFVSAVLKWVHILPKLLAFDVAVNNYINLKPP